MANSMRALLLRTPLHRLAGRHLLLHLPDGDVVLRYHRAADGPITVLASGTETWWRGLADDEGTPVRVTISGQTADGQLRFLSGEDLDAALIPYLQANPDAWTMLGIQPDATEDDVADAAQGAGVGQITLS